MAQSTSTKKKAKKKAAAKTSKKKVAKKAVKKTPKAAPKKDSHIVKRHGHSQVFDEKKVYASVYAAAINCHLSELDSEQLALKVMNAVNKWIDTKPEVNSHSIRDKIIEHIVDEDIILMYKHHLDLC